MKWMKERDLLIAQTVAFVQSVTGKKPDLERPAAVETTVVTTTTVVNVEAVPEPPAAIQPDVAPPPVAASVPAKPAPVARPAIPADFRSEIQARVANFRAHQERITREREEYCRATMAKVRATLRDDGEAAQAAE